MQILSFYVNKQEIRQVNSENVVNNSTNYLKLHFDFEETDWDNVAKRVLFKAQSTEVYCKELDEHEEVIVPHEVLNDDYFLFSLYGVDDDLRITTAQTRISLARSGYSENIVEPLPPTPSVIDDLYDSISDVNDNVTAVNNRVNDTNGNVTALGTDLNQTKSNILNMNATLDQAVLDIRDINTKLDNTIEMEVTFEDETTATYNLVVKPDESD